MKQLLHKLLGLTLLLAFPIMAFEEPGVEEIVARAERAAYYAGKDGRARIKMTITDARGGTRERAFTILRLNVGENSQKFYVYFEAPADVRKMAYLVWKNRDGNDDRWLWMPALNLVKRIAPGDKRSSFVGSDFVYEDVSGRSPSEDKHELVSTGETHWQLKNTPLDADSVGFSHYMVWIDKLTWLPSKAEYYDKTGKLYRRVEALKVETIQGFPTVMESRVTDLRSGSSTTNTFREVTYELGLGDRIFTERFLRRPPREVR